MRKFHATALIALAIVLSSCGDATYTNKNANGNANDLDNTFPNKEEKCTSGTTACNKDGNLLTCKDGIWDERVCAKGCKRNAINQSYCVKEECSAEKMITCEGKIRTVTCGETPQWVMSQEVCRGKCIEDKGEFKCVDCTENADCCDGTEVCYYNCDTQLHSCVPKDMPHCSGKLGFTCRTDKTYALSCDDTVISGFAENSCSETAPYCDKIKNECVECIKDNSDYACIDAELKCNASGRCVECLKDSDCATGLCDDSGRCINCDDDHVCNSGYCLKAGTSESSESTGGQCVECIKGDDERGCKIGYCNDSNQCVECLNGSDCDSGVCDASGKCVNCSDEGDCGDEFVCHSELHKCVECVGDDDCAAGKQYCSSDNICVACISDEHCGDGICEDYNCRPCQDNEIPLYGECVDKCSFEAINHLLGTKYTDDNAFVVSGSESLDEWNRNETNSDVNQLIICGTVELNNDPEKINHYIRTVRGIHIKGVNNATITMSSTVDSLSSSIFNKIEGVENGVERAIVEDLKFDGLTLSLVHGIIDTANYAIFKNIHLDTVTIDYNHDHGTVESFGALIGVAEQVTLIDISASGITVNANADKVGGLIGSLNGVQNNILLKNKRLEDGSLFDIKEVSGHDDVGGLIGYVEQQLNMTGTQDQLISIHTDSVSGNNAVGGVIGLFNGKESTLNKISNKVDKSTGSNFVGGFIGRTIGVKNFFISDVVNEYRFVNSSLRTGGFIGDMSSTNTNIIMDDIKNICSHGDNGVCVSSGQSAAGFIARVDSVTTSLDEHMVGVKITNVQNKMPAIKEMSSNNPLGAAGFIAEMDLTSNGTGEMLIDKVISIVDRIEGNGVVGGFIAKVDFGNDNNNKSLMISNVATKTGLYAQYGSAVDLYKVSSDLRRSQEGVTIFSNVLSNGAGNSLKSGGMVGYIGGNWYEENIEEGLDNLYYDGDKLCCGYQNCWNYSTNACDNPFFNWSLFSKYLYEDKFNSKISISNVVVKTDNYQVESDERIGRNILNGYIEKVNNRDCATTSNDLNNVMNKIYGDNVFMYSVFQTCADASENCYDIHDSGNSNIAINYSTPIKHCWFTDYNRFGFIADHYWNGEGLSPLSPDFHAPDGREYQFIHTTLAADKINAQLGLTGNDEIQWEYDNNMSLPVPVLEGSVVNAD